MDAKQACDKLNGFNFQSRYLVGASTLNISRQRHLNIQYGHVEPLVSISLLTCPPHSTISPARKNGQVKRGH